MIQAPGRIEGTVSRLAMAGGTARRISYSDLDSAAEARNSLMLCSFEGPTPPCTKTPFENGEPLDRLSGDLKLRVADN